MSTFKRITINDAKKDITDLIVDGKYTLQEGDGNNPTLQFELEEGVQTIPAVFVNCGITKVTIGEGVQVSAGAFKGNNLSEDSNVDSDALYVESTDYDYIYNEASWNDSYENGALKNYYAKYPQEDLWNTKENRAVNFNDRMYEGTIDGEAVECDVKWASEAAQKLTIDGTVYYAPIFYDMEYPRDCELYTDAALTESADKTLSITKITFSEDCQHCWEGSINAPGAKYPWICPHFKEGVTETVVFRYEDKEDVTPWSKAINWGCASVPVELGEEFLLQEDGTTAFDISKFKMLLK